MADGDVTDSVVSGGKDRNEREIEKDSDGRPQKKLAKKTVLKDASKSKKTTQDPNCSHVADGSKY